MMNITCHNNKFIINVTHGGSSMEYWKLNIYNTLLLVGYRIEL